MKAGVRTSLLATRERPVKAIMSFVRRAAGTTSCVAYVFVSSRTQP
jgi:hypothetical protein